MQLIRSSRKLYFPNFPDHSKHPCGFGCSTSKRGKRAMPHIGALTSLPSSSALFSPPLTAGKVALLASLPDSELSLNSEPGVLVLRTFAQMYENSKHLRDGSKQPFQEQHLAAPRQDKVKGDTVRIRSESLFSTLRKTTGISGLISFDFDCEPNL